MAHTSVRRVWAIRRSAPQTRRAGNGRAERRPLMTRVRERGSGMAGATRNPKKVAILGGGVAALAAAFELSDPRHGGAFEVTLHQLGWRLGGKCASGRDMDARFQFRIKEHGPHIFFGFYDNGFALLREAYAELERDP